MTLPGRYILAPYVPTPDDIVARMLELASVTANDVVYDLGCGDGRVVVEAARRCGARGTGFDIEDYWVDEARRRAAETGVAQITSFERADALEVDLSPATVIYLYLVEWSVQMLVPNIERMSRPGTRVVSLSFGIEAWTPAVVDRFDDAEGTARRLYLYRVQETTSRSAIRSPAV